VAELCYSQYAGLLALTREVFVINGLMAGIKV